MIHHKMIFGVVTCLLVSMLVSSCMNCQKENVKHLQSDSAPSHTVTIKTYYNDFSKPEVYKRINGDVFLSIIQNGDILNVDRRLLKHDELIKLDSMICELNKDGIKTFGYTNMATLDNRVKKVVITIDNNLICQSFYDEEDFEDELLTIYKYLLNL